MNNLHQNANSTPRTVKAKGKRHDTFAFIRDHIRQHGYTPSRDDVARHIGFSCGTSIHRIVGNLRNAGLIETEPDGKLLPTLSKDDLQVKEVITRHIAEIGYPPRFEDIQARTQLDTNSITYSLRLLQLWRVIRWDESKVRGIHLRQDMPTIKQWHDTGSRAAARQERIDALKSQLPKPAPTNIIPMPFPVSEIHAPAIPKLSSNHVYSIVSSNIQHHTASIEDIAGSVADYAANILKVRHDDPQRGEIFECAIRALVQHAAEMVGASAYLVWADESPDETKAPEIERTAKAG